MNSFLVTSLKRGQEVAENTSEDVYIYFRDPNHYKEFIEHAKKNYITKLKSTIKEAPILDHFEVNKHKVFISIAWV